MRSSISEGCPSLVGISHSARNSLEGHIGIEITAVGPDFLCGEMPVDERTRQPFGLLHGGASIALAESLGSYGSWLLVKDEEGARVAGVEVSGSHLKAVRSGRVRAVCRPVNLGRSLHVWRILIRDESGDLNCAANLTVKISRPRFDRD